MHGGKKTTLFFPGRWEGGAYGCVTGARGARAARLGTGRGRQSSRALGSPGASECASLDGGGDASEAPGFSSCDLGQETPGLGLGGVHLPLRVSRVCGVGRARRLSPVTVSEILRKSVGSGGDKRVTGL